MKVGPDKTGPGTFEHWKESQHPPEVIALARKIVIANYRKRGANSYAAELERDWNWRSDHGDQEKEAVALAAILETTERAKLHAQAEIVEIYDDSPDIDVECNNLVRRLVDDFGAFDHLKGPSHE